MNDQSMPMRPWWKEPYLWLVLGLPMSVVLACVITAVYILQGPEPVVLQDRMPKARAMEREIGQAGPALQPALVGRNHSATGGTQHARP